MTMDLRSLKIHINRSSRSLRIISVLIKLAENRYIYHIPYHLIKTRDLTLLPPSYFDSFIIFCLTWLISWYFHYFYLIWLPCDCFFLRYAYEVKINRINYVLNTFLNCNPCSNPSWVNSILMAIEIKEFSAKFFK